MNPDGAQPQRTGLAWRRTALACAGCTLLLLNSAARQGWGLAVVPGVLAAVTTALLAVTGSVRDRVFREQARPTAPSAPMIAAATVLVAATSASALSLLH
ncbi:DUF202 domain-containing protein [Amycolatopsis anabasis]|uniref:DUF202 domain-containing protein n=1 Tax=Amycolatopsis anabasis TaxID=1840409 RepID=UPI00131E3FC9|nr:DUF202 domain-containing protein [Amycolatopsis anabasis]